MWSLLSVGFETLCSDILQGRVSFLLKGHNLWESPSQGTARLYGYGHADLGRETFQMMEVPYVHAGQGHLCCPGDRGNNVISLWPYGLTLQSLLWSLVPVGLQAAAPTMKDLAPCHLVVERKGG